MPALSGLAAGIMHELCGTCGRKEGEMGSGRR